MFFFYFFTISFSLFWFISTNFTLTCMRSDTAKYHVVFFHFLIQLKKCKPVSKAYALDGIDCWWKYQNCTFSPFLLTLKTISCVWAKSPYKCDICVFIPIEFWAKRWNRNFSDCGEKYIKKEGNSTFFLDLYFMRY